MCDNKVTYEDHALKVFFMGLRTFNSRHFAFQNNSITMNVNDATPRIKNANTVINQLHLSFVSLRLF
jgi:hypothetical protein